MSRQNQTPRSSTQQSVAHPAITRLSPTVGVPLAVAAGLAVALQGRLNSALGAAMGDNIGAAFLSFSSGLVIITLVTLALPGGRASLRRVRPALQHRSFPRYFLIAGVAGGYLVLSQTLTVGLIGIALFTVAVVMGQSISGLVVDQVGLSPAGKRPISGMRVLSIVVVIASVIWAVSPHFSGSSGIATWLLPVLLPLSAGFFMSFQQAMNATQSVHYGSPLPATMINFVAGTIALGLIWASKLALAGAPRALATDWWLYLGGAIGCLFIGLSAWLVRHMGALITGLGTIAGQLLGSLALDVFAPTQGSVVTVATVTGTILTLLGMTLATLPWRRRIQPANSAT